MSIYWDCVAFHRKSGVVRRTFTARGFDAVMPDHQNQRLFPTVKLITCLKVNSRDGLRSCWWVVYTCRYENHQVNNKEWSNSQGQGFFHCKPISSTIEILMARVIPIVAAIIPLSNMLFREVYINIASPITEQISIKIASPTAIRMSSNDAAIAANLISLGLLSIFLSFMCSSVPTGYRHPINPIHQLLRIIRILTFGSILGAILEG